jgi:hypothetical protein
MEIIKKYKIYCTHYVYSKKKGSHPKKIRMCGLLAKNLTLENAREYVKTEFPHAKETSPNYYQISSMLFPGIIEIK